MIRRPLILTPMLLCLVLTVASCGGSSEQGSAPKSAGSSTASAQPDIVGFWTRNTTCEERVKALTDAGMGKFATSSVVEDGMVPGVTSVDQIKDSSKPCAGAVPLKHGHFFTEDHQFGSTDDGNNQVDDGTYRIVDKNTIVIDKVTFDYTVKGDELRLFPVLPKCAASGCPDAQWAVSVSYNGLPWKRTAS